jgi:FKBP-type peptidyl-prolyl cis-trans isomerase FkpA
MRLTAALLLAAAPIFAADPTPKPEPAKPVAVAKPAAKPTVKPEGAPASEDQNTLYTLGYYLGTKLAPFSLSESELKPVLQGLRDSVLGKKSSVDVNVYGPKINELASARERKKAEARKGKEKASLDKYAAEKGADKSASGLIYKELSAGKGAQPKAEDTVKVHYKGVLTDGSEFDSSYKRGEPAQFPLNGVIKCWTEGVAKMKVGGKSQLVCPSAIAYGDEGRPGIPGGATLVFEVELLDIIKK